MAISAAAQEIFDRVVPYGNGDTGGTMIDPVTGRLYTPQYTSSGSWGDASDATYTISGWRGYDQIDGTEHEQYHNTPYTSYDAEGNEIGTGTWDLDGDLSKQAIMAVMMMAGGALAGGAMAGGAAAGEAGAAGAANGMWDVAGASGGFDLGGGLSMGANGEILGNTLAGGGTMTNAGIDSLIAGEGFGTAAGGGLSSTFNAAVDSQAANQALGLGPYTGAANPAQYLGMPGLPGGDPSSFIPGVDSQLANSQLGLSPVTDMTGPAVPSNWNTPGTGTGTNTIPDYGQTPPGGTTPPGTTPPGGTPNNTGGAFDWGSLLGVLGGLWDKNNQNNASDEMLKYLKERQGINDNMYAPGSNEYNALWDEMSRKDAAAGRNSQYGPRSVDLGARIAQLKMDANTRMTTGIGGLYKSAIDQGANSNAGLMSSLGDLFSKNSNANGLVNSGLGSLTSYLGNLFKT